MKTFTLLKQILLVALVTFVATSSYANIDEYGFKKKDKAKEKQKFLIKLGEDQKKINLAIENTKVLIGKSRNMPYLPELYMRLAELYIEKSRIIYFTRQQQSPKGSKALHNLEANSLKNKAIETYQRVINDFPEFADKDKVYFFMAHEYRELAKIPLMVKQYRHLIKQFPKSTYVPEAYLLLGDHFINAQDLDMALHHYKKVLDYPKSSAIAIARYKLAWCHVNKGEFNKAIKLFEASVTSMPLKKELDIDTYKRVDIKLESLIDMAFCYPECYKKSTPQQALTYFKSYAWSRQVYVLVLEKLAYRYFIKKKWDHAARIYRTLADLQHDTEKLLEYAANIFECVRTMDNFENADEDMQVIVKALRRQKYSIHIPKDKKNKNLKTYELYARNIVTHLHQKARSKNSVSAFQKAADAYDVYLSFFENSPKFMEMKSNFAETLFASENYLAAGKQYESLLKSKKKKASPTSYQDLMYSTITSYYHALKNKKYLNYYEIAYARDGLKVNGNSYIATYKNDKKVPDVLFNVAWITFDEGKYDEAISIFSKFIDKYPSGKATESAIHLILDAYHQKEDYEGLANFGRSIVADRRINSLVRADVLNIVKASESKLVVALTIDAVNDWDKGKSNIESFVEKHKKSPLGEQALNALLISGKEKGELETILSAGHKLLKYYPKSELKENALGIMIDTAVKSAQYRVVAKYLEAFSQTHTKHEKYNAFIQQAGRIREGLGQYHKSNQNLQKLLKRLPKKSNSRTNIAFTIAENAIKSKNSDFAISTLTSEMKNFSTIDQLKANSLIAALYFQEGHTKKALRYFKKAQKRYKKSYGRKYPEIDDKMAQSKFLQAHSTFQKYMDLKLNKKINDKLVAQKAQLRAQLEKKYAEIMQYKAPAWVLQACYFAHEINNEFARFLINAPVPELSSEQKTQYQKLIQVEAKTYQDKANKYLSACIQQAHKWELCDPTLTQFYSQDSIPSTFSAGLSSTEIGEQFLNDAELCELHKSLILNPNDGTRLMNLAKAYFNRQDYWQTILLTKKISEDKKGPSPNMARVYTLMGTAYLYVGKDQMAQQMYKKALLLNPDQIDARANLAALYKHYAHDTKASTIFKSIKTNDAFNTSDLIHPKAKDMYNAYNQTKTAKK